MTGLKKLMIVAMMGLSVALFGCESEGPAERAGEKIDEAVETAEEKMDDAAQHVEETGEEIREKMQ